MDATLRMTLEGQRFGLVLSAGFFGFYGHAGFLAALGDVGLSPAAYAGTSAGGLVAAHAALGMAPDALIERLLAHQRGHFWDPDPLGALLAALQGGPASTGLLRGARLRASLERSLGSARLEDCARPLVLCATNLTQGRSEVFETGALAPRVHATCAYPGLFRAVELDGALYWDGGLVDKAPLLALAQSAHGRELDAFVVHYLPSRAAERVGGALAYARGMATGLAIGRREHFRLQRRVVEASGRPVYVLVSDLPALSPAKLSQAAAVVALARQTARRALDAPYQSVEP